jgi:hypothetical protein
MASRFKILGRASLLALAAVIAFIVFSPKIDNSGSNRPAPTGQRADDSQKEIAVNFSSPVYTKQSALVCPLAVAFDPREGLGLKGAMDAHLSIFGHDEAVAKSGCQEWREGLPISLTDEGKKQAAQFDAEHMCGMVSFTYGYIFSCDLRNGSVVEHAEQQVADALQDPSKVRFMECIGVNPWKVKPAGWTPPTEQECAALKQKLGAAADAKETAVIPEAPSNEVKSLIAEEEKLNDKCRGGPGDDKETLKACDERDSVFGEIKARGWCWGHDGQIEADKVWERCPGVPTPP